MPNWSSQDPGSWGWKRGNAADLVPFFYAGHVFPHGVARGTDVLFRAALDRICAQPGFTLPPSPELSAGMWGYADRRKSGGGGWSFHAYGLAIDIAAPWNPMGSRIPAPGPHRLPSNTGELVRPLGLLWGGSFGDWMHLECHLSPAEVRDWDQLPLPLGRNSRTDPCPLPPGAYWGPRDGPTSSISNMVNPKPELVAGLQRVQRELGVQDDGLYGPRTAAAARSWQGAHGLTPDGLIGIRTWGRLFWDAG